MSAVLYAFLSVYALWLFYLAVMALKRAKDAGSITKTALYLGYPLLFIGLIIDVVVNITVMSVLFLEAPQEWVVTSRLGRLLRDGDGWRKKLAGWFCTNLLDAFDPSGKHCGGE